MSDLIQARDYWIKRAERAERYIQTQSQSIEDLRVDLARRDDIIKRLVEDGERLTAITTQKKTVFGADYYQCPHCDGCDYAVQDIDHAPDCPITLHRALMKEVEG